VSPAFAGILPITPATFDLTSISIKESLHLKSKFIILKKFHAGRKKAKIALCGFIK
jgi:hypothetical protein